MSKTNELTQEKVDAYFKSFEFIRKDELFGRDAIALVVLQQDEPDKIFFAGNYDDKDFIKSSAKKMEKLNFATEKIKRVMLNDLTTSFEMSDENGKKFGGAIQVSRGLFISCSGLPPHMDQEFCIHVARMMDRLPLHQQDEIIKRTVKDYIYWKKKYQEM